MWFKPRFAVLAVILIALVSLVPSVRANPGPHVAVPQAPLSIGQPVYITYYTNVGEDGLADVYIIKPPSTSDLWHSGWITISGGLAYDVTAPGLSDPGTYTAGVVYYKPPCPAPCSSMQYVSTSFQVVGSTTTTSTPGTDWAVLSVSLNPLNPNVGDPVMFGMVMTALSSPGPFPQDFSAVCEVDGVSCGSGSFTYPGPVDTPFTVSTQRPWIATPGTHTLAWGVATIPVGLDPNKGNNLKSIVFTVAQAPPPQTTIVSSTSSQAPSDFQVNVAPSSQTVLQGETVSYSVDVVGLNGFNSQVSLTVSGLPSGASGVFSVSSGTPNFASILTVTLSASVPVGSFTLTITGTGGGISHIANVLLTVNQSTQTSSPTETTTSVGSDITDIVQQNPLIVLGAIALILLAVLALRRRPTRATPVPQPPTNVIYCSKCGNQNPTTNQFCKKCGAKVG